MSTDTNQNRYERYSEYTPQYISSMTVNLRQLQTSLTEQHQHEKETLIGLNESLGLLLRRVQSLQTQNTKYLDQIVDFYRQSSGISNYESDWSEQHTRLYSNFSSASNENIDHEFNYELFRLQTEIYQKLIDAEQQSKDNRCLKLEQELQQLTSALAGIKTSHADKQQEVQLLISQRQKLVDQYLNLTYGFSNARKQRKQWNLRDVTLKSQIEFYKSLRTYTQQNIGHVYSGENIQLSSSDLSDIVKRIRHDFELLYSKIYNAMTSYYVVKTQEVENAADEIIHNQELELHQQKQIQQKLQIEYEDVQKSLSIEQETSKKLEATLEKLAAELESIQRQNEERFDMQISDYQNMQDGIATINFNVGETQRNIFNLETELIIYRHLLGDVNVKQRVTTVKHPTTSEISDRFVIENKTRRRGSIGIKDCAPNGKYITIRNYSASKDFDISKWMIKRCFNTVPDLFYTLPDGIRIPRGEEIIISSKPQSNETSIKHLQGSSVPPHREIVNDDVISWGSIGNAVETILFNRNGDEESSYIQALVFRNE